MLADVEVVVVSGSKIGRQEPGSRSCSGLESESPNSSHSGDDSVGSTSEEEEEEGISLMSSCVRIRKKGRAKREMGRRENIRRESVSFLLVSFSVSETEKFILTVYFSSNRGGRRREAKRVGVWFVFAVGVYVYVCVCHVD